MGAAQRSSNEESTISLAIFLNIPETRFQSDNVSLSLPGALKERRSQLEQFERDKGDPKRTGHQADGNRRDNEHVTHDLHPQILEGADCTVGWTAIGAPVTGLPCEGYVPTVPALRIGL